MSGGQAFTRGLVWLRNDLRSADNTALYRAGLGCRALAAIFIACPQTWRSHDDGDPVVDFRLECLRELQPRLAQLNIPLYFLELETFAQVPRALVQIVERLKIDVVFANAEYPLNERRRDSAVREALKEIDVPIEYCSDRTLVPPGSLKTGSGDAYKVFTPFKRAFVADFGDQPFAPVPEPGGRARESLEHWPQWIELRGSQNLHRAIPDTVQGYGRVPRVRGAPLSWPAGEAPAVARLDEFLERIDDYERRRDLPAVDGTSRLSPYLNCGAISVRQCASAALEHNRGFWLGGSDGVCCWLGELLWREFYTHLVDAFPDLCRHKPFKPETEKLPWSGDELAFRRWCLGKTGVPIVDAAMRQLNNTGWMHNRLRMVTASFLSKNLLLDWRWGERYFMHKLIDADFAANNGGWQWAASTGTDAVPYFRVFNPYSQSKKFDGRGDFIRRFVPELQSLSEKEIHDPPRVDGYPPPICDVSESRKRAIEIYASLK